MLVLIADDEPTTCALVAGILQGAGHQVVIARDAMQTLHLARSRQPDVVILDIMMPAGTGIGALEKMRSFAHTQLIPVIVLSGVTAADTMQRAMQLGALEFLQKPVDETALLNALERVQQKPG